MTLEYNLLNYSAACTCTPIPLSTLQSQNPKKRAVQEAPVQPGTVLEVAKRMRMRPPEHAMTLPASLSTASRLAPDLPAHLPPYSTAARVSSGAASQPANIAVPPPPSACEHSGQGLASHLIAAPMGSSSSLGSISINTGVCAGWTPSFLLFWHCCNL